MTRQILYMLISDENLVCVGWTHQHSEGMVACIYTLIYMQKLCYAHTEEASRWLNGQRLLLPSLMALGAHTVEGKSQLLQAVLISTHLL